LDPNLLDSLRRTSQSYDQTMPYHFAKVYKGKWPDVECHENMSRKDRRKLFFCITTPQNSDNLAKQIFDFIKERQK